MGGIVLVINVATILPFTSLIVYKLLENAIELVDLFGSYFCPPAKKISFGFSVLPLAA
ncbi:MAG: hypothetical protein BWY22_02606 [Bacteroidetes bacterium ADurb.Bin217]|nr:MAG: hypothetical protein BWY22_02606 [Bacteroidetes bacterium ADurb.Bin217]